MAAYSFKRRFVEPIRLGTKHHTIRADRKDGRVPKAGEQHSLWCGLRTKQCFRILPGTVECTKVQRIVIQEAARGPGTAITREIFVEGIQLAPDECERLAIVDGFENFADMMQFWDRPRLPFKGHIIHWK